jgi:CRP-like cAMP-binding protein
METEIRDSILGLKDELKVFSRIGNEELEKVVPFFEIVKCPDGATLFKEGDPGGFIGFISSGRFEVKKETEFKGRYIVLAVLTRGSLVGELSFIDEGVRSATVTAREDSSLIVLRRDEMDLLLKKHPYTGIKILEGLNRLLAVRMRKAVDRLKVIF